MNCWKILGIEPSADKKTIKIAYSKLLKTTRPDDDPEGFQQLHSAYKRALAEANSSNDSPTVESVDAANFNSSQTDEYDAHIDLDKTTSIDPSHDSSNQRASGAPDNTEHNRVDDELEKEWQHFTALVNSILQNPKTVNDVNAWEPVVKSSLITDLQFKNSASDYVFDAVSEKNVISLENKVFYVQPKILNHLNTFFSWGINWSQLERKFNSTRLDAVLPYLDKEETYEAPKEALPHIISKIVGYACTLLAIIAGYHHVNLFIAITILAIPTTINRVYTRKWQTQNYGRVIGAEDERIEQNKYLLFITLFLAMWLVLLMSYGIGWGIHYVVSTVFS